MENIRMKFKDAPIGARFHFIDENLPKEVYVKIHDYERGLVVQWNGNVKGRQSHCCWLDEENGIDFDTEIELINCPNNNQLVFIATEFNLKTQVKITSKKRYPANYEVKWEEVEYPEQGGTLFISTDGLIDGDYHDEDDYEDDESYVSEGFDAYVEERAKEILESQGYEVVED